MLSTDTIARVILNIGSLAADAASFDTGLLLVKPSSWTDAKRLRAYSSSAEATAGMVSDGFAVSSDEYKAAVRYFSASPAPGKSPACVYASIAPLKSFFFSRRPPAS